MAESILSAPHFHNEEAAFEHVESLLWPDGPTCPHCGSTEEHIGRLQGKSSRIGLRKCYGCRKTFTVRIGTIFEDSHLALHLWLQVIHLMCANKKGISTRQIQRLLQCSMKTAWFLTHRIREAMKDGTIGPLRGDLHTNTIEGYFSILKQGNTGCYFNVSEAHLHRYLAELDFRYSNREKLEIDDMSRANPAVQGFKGKRLTYKRPGLQATT